MDNFLSEYLGKVGIEADEKQIEQLNTYYEMLVEKNKVMNLTGITEYKEVVIKHFADSAAIIKAMDLKKIGMIIDIGTGAGFPGIVLKILFPHIKITLLDSLNKRIQFLNRVIEELNLEDISTIHGRAEDYAKTHRESFDIVTAREKGITVCNAGSYSTNAVAQQVIGYILMHYTKVFPLVDITF